MTWDSIIPRETKNEISRSARNDSPRNDNARELTYLEAIRDALQYEMRRDPRVLVMGEDVGVFGGAFKLTQGLFEEFGEERVIDTPMAELCMVGAATGMAFMGLRPVVEMQFADFISTGFDSIVQFAATNHYRWGAPVPWVIRAPGGGGLRGGPFHSQNPEAWFVHAPGLKVVAPATPADARGLLLSALRDPNPVIYFEYKALYRSIRGNVPEGEEGIVPIGRAKTARAGNDLSIITYGAPLHEALKAADELARENVSVEILDLRSLKPLDTDAILETARKTSKVMIVHEANLTCGVGAEIAALISQHAFEFLDAPIVRLAAPDIPPPYAPILEDASRPNKEKILQAAKKLLAY
ncbi:MAG: alpha-ketoacid dehydrogenase subunit beta [Chloroflexi bacterium UTCFX4]|jgi:2-oxoisovalerate dehydrogenase E1 component beta subunit|nr:MAG: alpha-ketoacid dehydrogenase subunit beta [Chloroflexi bacterium UTCFX4]